MRLPDPTKPFLQQDPVILLAMCIFGEARGQSDEAKRGVANVVRNRVLRGGFGHGWAGVILKPYQFSCFRMGDPNRPKLLNPPPAERDAWARCVEIAERTFAGALQDNTGGSTHYYDDSIAANPPVWAGRFAPTIKLGRLNFFREP